ARWSVAGTGRSVARVGNVVTTAVVVPVRWALGSVRCVLVPVLLWWRRGYEGLGVLRHGRGRRCCRRFRCRLRGARCGAAAGAGGHGGLVGFAVVGWRAEQPDRQCDQSRERHGADDRGDFPVSGPVVVIVAVVVGVPWGFGWDVGRVAVLRNVCQAVVTG